MRYDSKRYRIIGFILSIFVSPSIILIVSAFLGNSEGGVWAAAFSIPFCIAVALFIGLPVVLIFEKADIVQYRYFTVIPVIFTVLCAVFVLEKPSSKIYHTSENWYFDSFTGSLLILFMMCLISTSVYWLFSRLDVIDNSM